MTVSEDFTGLTGRLSGYALAGAALGTPPLLQRPHPCPGWDPGTLLDHLRDSIGVLHAITAGDAGASAAWPGYPGPGPDPVARPRGQASPGDQLVAFLGRQPRPPAAPRARRHLNRARGAGRSAAIPGNPAGLYQ